MKNDCGSIARKGLRARRGFVEYDAEGKEIRAVIQVFAARLFGRHVGDGAKRTAGTGEIGRRRIHGRFGSRIKGVSGAFGSS